MDFQKEVIEESSKVPVLVDFWAPWCGPCQFVGPVVEKLSKEANGNWKLVKVNTDENQDIAMEWDIRGIPNLKLFYHGKVIAQLPGALPEYTLKKWLDENLPSESKTLLAKADKAIKEHKLSEAEKLLKQAIELDHDLEEAKILLGQLKLFENPGEAYNYVHSLNYIPEAEAILTIASLLNTTDSDLPEDLTREIILKGIEALRKQDFDNALEQFVTAISINKDYKDELARKAVVALFQYLGEQHEITKKFKRRFSMALY